MDTSRQAIALCIEGTQAEFERRLDDARALYARAWEVADDSYERCIAAHYVAHLEPDASERLRWNLLALQYAGTADQALVAPLYGSLYVNMGASYESVGDLDSAQSFYDLAEKHGVTHHEGYDPAP